MKAAEQQGGYTRLVLSTPDGGSVYCDTYDFSMPHRPWHLVGWGMNFATPIEAQDHVNATWDEEPGPVDNSYAIAEASFGEYEE